MTHRKPTSRILRLALAGAAISFLGLGTPYAEEIAAESDAPVLVGEVTREQIESLVPDWVRAQVEAEIDTEAAQALASVPPAEIIVYLGTWCSDSRREVPRFWRALDQTGGLVQFSVEYVAVDEDKQEPAQRLEDVDLRYVPTFVVRRDGEELGRVVEVAETGIERDLLALLTGQARGVVSGRDEAEEGAEDPAQEDPGTP